jgi:hypothetical protein
VLGEHLAVRGSGALGLSVAIAVMVSATIALGRGSGARTELLAGSAAPGGTAPLATVEPHPADIKSAQLRPRSRDGSCHSSSNT